MEENTPSIAFGVFALIMLSLLLLLAPDMTLQLWFELAGVVVLFATFVAIVHYTRTTSELLKIELRRKEREDHATNDLILSLWRWRTDKLEQYKNEVFELQFDNIGGPCRIREMSAQEGVSIIDWGRKEEWPPTLGKVRFYPEGGSPLRHFNFTVVYSNRYDEWGKSKYNVLILPKDDLHEMKMRGKKQVREWYRAHESRVREIETVTLWPNERG